MPRRSTQPSAYDSAVLGLSQGTAPEGPLAERIARYRDDFPAFASDLLWIVDKDGELLPLRLNRPQQLLWERFILPAQQREEPVRVVVLKARQMGFTTMIQGLAYHRTSLWPRQSALVAAHRKESSNKIFRMLKRYHKHAPEDFRPSRRLSNRAELLFDANTDDVLGLESHITTDTADNPDLGAGETLRFVHFSEAARFESASSQPMTDKMATVKQSVPLRPGTFVFLESTAQGEGYFRDFWYDESNGYTKAFVPWLADDTYTQPAGLALSELHGRADGPYGDEISEHEVVQAALRDWSPADKAADTEWVQAEALRRLAWRRTMIDTQLERDLRLWDQEYPSTPEHAFGASSRGAFLPEVIARLRAASPAPSIYSVQQPEGPGGPVQVVADTHGALRVFLPPGEPARPGDRKPTYVIGADVAEGVPGGDFSVAQVLAFDPADRPRATQAAIYRERLDPAAFGHAVARLAEMYTGPDGRPALVVPEINSVGLLTTEVLFRRGARLYQRRVYDRLNATHTFERGFRTTPSSKPFLIETLRAAFNYGHLEIFDPQTLDEMARFLLIPPGPGRMTTKYEAPPGKDSHDDTVLSLALAYLGIDYQDEPAIPAGPPSPHTFLGAMLAAGASKAAGKWRNLTTI